MYETGTNHCSNRWQKEIFLGQNGKSIVSNNLGNFEALWKNESSLVPWMNWSALLPVIKYIKSVKFEEQQGDTTIAKEYWGEKWFYGRKSQYFELKKCITFSQSFVHCKHRADLKMTDWSVRTLVIRKTGDWSIDKRRGMQETFHRREKVQVDVLNTLR